MRFHLGGLVLNKVLPSYLLDAEAARVARRFCSDADSIAADLDGDLGDPAQVARVLTEVGESYMRFQVVAKREAEQRAELAEVPDVVAPVPYLDTDVHDIGGLLQVGEAVWRVHV